MQRDNGLEQSTFSQEFQIEKKWIGKEFVWLLLYSMLYTGCFVGMHTLFSFIGCSEASMSMALLKAVLQIWLFLTTLLFEMSILCNLFCAIGGSAVGILLSMLCVIGLIMWATSEAAGNLSQIINPMWLSADIIENTGSYIKKLLVLLIQMAVCAGVSGYYLAKRDLFAREGEG